MKETSGKFQPIFKQGFPWIFSVFFLVECQYKRHSNMFSELIRIGIKPADRKYATR